MVRNVLSVELWDAKTGKPATADWFPQKKKDSFVATVSDAIFSTDGKAVLVVSVDFSDDAASYSTQLRELATGNLSGLS